MILKLFKIIIGAVILLSRHLDNVKGESAESIPWNLIQNIATLQNTPEREK